MTLSNLEYALKPVVAELEAVRGRALTDMERALFAYAFNRGVQRGFADASGAVGLALRRLPGWTVSDGGAQ